MNEQTLFIIFFFIIFVAFFYGTDKFYEQFDCFKNLQFDEITWRLISLSVASLLCAIYWNYHISNYV